MVLMMIAMDKWTKADESVRYLYSFQVKSVASMMIVMARWMKESKMPAAGEGRKRSLYAVDDCDGQVDEGEESELRNPSSGGLQRSGRRLRRQSGRRGQE